MQNKCNKYEAYYVFSDEAAFEEHLKDCPDCQKEHIKMQKISNLVQSVKDEYASNQSQRKKLVSCAAFLIFSFATIAAYGIYSYNAPSALSETSLLYDLGCPVDEYGLLKM